MQTLAVIARRNSKQWGFTWGETSEVSVLVDDSTIQVREAMEVEFYSIACDKSSLYGQVW